MSELKWGSVPLAAISKISAYWDNANSKMTHKLVNNVMVVKPSNDRKSSSGSAQYSSTSAISLEFCSLTLHGDWIIGQSRNYAGQHFEYNVNFDDWEKNKLLAIYTKGNTSLDNIVKSLDKDVIYAGSITFDANGHNEAVHDLAEIEDGDEKLYMKMFKVESLFTRDELVSSIKDLPNEVAENKGGNNSKGVYKQETTEEKLQGTVKFLSGFLGCDLTAKALLAVPANELTLGLMLVGVYKVDNLASILSSEQPTVSEQSEPVTETPEIAAGLVIVRDFVDNLPSRKIPKGFVLDEQSNDWIYMMGYVIQNYDVNNSDWLVENSLIEGVSKVNSVLAYTLDELITIKANLSL